MLLHGNCVLIVLHLCVVVCLFVFPSCPWPVRLDESNVPEPLISRHLAHLILRTGKSIRFLVRLCNDRQGLTIASQAEEQLRREREGRGMREGTGGNRGGAGEWGGLEMIGELVERVSGQVERHLVEVSER